MANPIKQLGQFAAQFAARLANQSLYQPPENTISGVDSSHWPSALQPVRPAGPPGSEPLGMTLQMGQNLIFTPRPDGVDADELKALSTYPLARMCIDNVKDQIGRAPIEFQVRARPGEGKADRLKREKGDKGLIDLYKRFEYPDGEHDWQEWVRPLIEDMLVIDAACYSSDVDVLTKRGWRKFSDVTLADEFATRTEDGNFEWQKATEIIVRQHDGELIHFTGRNTDILVTPNHNMLVAPLTSITYKATKPAAREWRKSQFGHPGAERKVTYDLIPAEQLEAKIANRAFPATSCWMAPDLPSFTVEIPRAKVQWRREQCAFSCSGDDFFAFMGMWLAEGCITKAGLSKQILISQLPKSKGFEAFRALLLKIRGKEVHHNGKVFRFHNQAMTEYLKQFGHSLDKFVPEIIKNGSARQIKLFLTYFALGDGNYRKNKPSDLSHTCFTTSSARLADDLQELCQKAGLSASIRPKPARASTIRGRQIGGIDGFTVYVRGTERVLYRRAVRVPYSGPVYCVTVPNHTLYVRRNGYPMWCGNSILLRRRTKGGDVAEMRVVPGETIARYVDDNGYTPQAPDVAYAQLWQGTPRVNLTTDQLVYKPRNIVRRSTLSSQLYGMSPTETIIDEIKIGLNRLAYVLSFYTEGSIPKLIQIIPRGVDKKDIAEIMAWQNSELAGNLAKRHQWRMMQGFHEDGKNEQIIEPREPAMADMFDDVHIRKIAFAYGTSPQRLQRAMNRASAEAGQEAAEEEGMIPWLHWLKGVLDYIIQRKLGLPGYEAIVNPSREPDVMKQAQADAANCPKLKTINETRKKNGDDPYADPNADKLGDWNAAGYFVPIETPVPAPPTPGAAGGPQIGPDGKPKLGPDGKPIPGKPVPKPNPTTPAGAEPAAAGQDENPKAPGTAAAELQGRLKQINRKFDGPTFTILHFDWEDEDDEALWASADEIQKKEYDPDQPRDYHGRWDDGGGQYDPGVRLKPSSKRAFQGEPVPLKKIPSWQETGKLGEAIIMAHLQQNEGGLDARPLNGPGFGNNYPLDVVQDHKAIEVKAGLVSNGESAQQWRAMLGKPGPNEKVRIEKMSANQARAYREQKMAVVMARKNKALAEIREHYGSRVRPYTFGTIINTDTHTADIYRFNGYHQRIGWNTPETQAAYLTSVKYQ